MAWLRVPCIVVLLCGAAHAREVGLDIEAHAPPERVLVEGATTSVRATDGTLLSLVVTYRPGSDVEITETLEVAGGQASWTPLHAGLANLDAEIEPAAGGEAVPYTQMVSVRFDTFLTAGLVVMVVAGTILFGGAFVSIRALLRGENNG
jgi:hypothetical protein